MDRSRTLGFSVKKITGHRKHANPQLWEFELQFFEFKNRDWEYLQDVLSGNSSMKDMLIGYLTRTFKGKIQLYMENVEGQIVYSVEEIAEIQKQVGEGRLKLVRDVMDPADPEAKRFDFKYIMGHKSAYGQDYLQIWWTGSSYAASTWEPLMHVADEEPSRDAVEDFIELEYRGKKTLQAKFDSDGNVFRYQIEDCA